MAPGASGRTPANGPAISTPLCLSGPAAVRTRWNIRLAAGQLWAERLRSFWYCWEMSYASSAGCRKKGLGHIRSALLSWRHPCGTTAWPASSPVAEYTRPLPRLLASSLRVLTTGVCGNPCHALRKSTNLHVLETPSTTLNDFPSCTKQLRQPPKRNDNAARTKAHASLVTSSIGGLSINIKWIRADQS